MIVFDMLREILQRSKQLEIFRFLPRISYFRYNGHSGLYPSDPTGLPCQNGNFAVILFIYFILLNFIAPIIRMEFYRSDQFNSNNTNSINGYSYYRLNDVNVQC